MPRHPRTLNAFFMMMALSAAAGRNAHAADLSCKPLLASLTKYINTPNHTYSEGTLGGRSVQKTETIFTGSERFVLTVRGWMANPMSTADILARTEENLGNARCQHVRDETVGAENTELYAFQVKNDLADSDGHLWISKRTGLPVKQEQTINAGDTPADARHVAERMSYEDVKAPSVAH